MKIKRFNITKKEYEDSNFIRIENFDIFHKVFTGHPLRIKRRDGYFERVIKLTQNNKKFLLNDFGKQDFVLTGEYWDYAWSFEFPNGVLIIFTGNRGTSYEFLGNPKIEDQDKLVKLFDIINKYE